MIRAHSTRRARSPPNRPRSRHEFQRPPGVPAAFFVDGGQPACRYARLWHFVYLVPRSDALSRASKAKTAPNLANWSDPIMFCTAVFAGLWPRFEQYRTCNCDKLAYLQSGRTIRLHSGISHTNMPKLARSKQRGMGRKQDKVRDGWSARPPINLPGSDRAIRSE